jgi:hypothetical protein
MSFVILSAAKEPKPGHGLLRFTQDDILVWPYHTTTTFPNVSFDSMSRCASGSRLMG